jgi:FkbM family methyltransferase
MPYQKTQGVIMKYKILQSLIFIYLSVMVLPLRLLSRIFRKYFLDIESIHAFKKIFSEKELVNDLYFDTFELNVFSRGRHFKNLEPDTIQWINNYIKKDEVFYDIGANIGVFSLYVAKNRGAKVYSFEPESSNYYYLNKNIFHNNLSEKIKAYSIALNDVDLLSVLNLSSFAPAKSAHNFNEELNPHHKKFDSPYKQGMLGMSLDDFIYKWGGKIPDHIKIDVDGNEYRIIDGMEKVFNEPKLKSIMVEISLQVEKDGALKEKILSKGFTLLKDEIYTNKSHMSIGYQNLFFVRNI